MQWATQYIEKLKLGEGVQFRPRGNSMKGKIESGQLVTVVPRTSNLFIDKNDIVLCEVNNNQYLHNVIDIRSHEGQQQYLIGNNRGRINGWISSNHIYGVVISVED